jgi:adenylate kinase
LKRAEHSSAFSAFGLPRAKLVLLGPDGPHFAELKARVRSFSIEHVSPATLVQQEISRRAPHRHSAAQQNASALSRPAAWQDADQRLLAIFRKWFWARKPDAGFLLEGFPATLLQAKVLDEWLEARGETLTGCFAIDPLSVDSVVTHYRTQGLLTGAARAAA